MLAAALIVGAVVILVMPSALAGVFYDDGIYLALAKSLAEGHGYHLQYLPGAPAAVHYPFGYPVFLAMLWKLGPAFPANVALMRLANALLLALFAALATGYLERRLALPPWVTAAVVIAATTAIPLLAVATVLFSEPLYLALTAAACWMADAALERAETDRSSLALAVGAGVLAGAAMLTRTIGLAVIAGIAVSFLVARRYRLAAAATVPALLILLPWLLWTRAHHGDVDPVTASNYGTYGDFLRQGGSHWLSFASLTDLARPLGAVFLPPVNIGLRLYLGLPALVTLIAGMLALTRRAPAAGWMLLAYIPIVAMWPYGPDRFLWGILPWLGVAFLAGADWLIRAWRSPQPAARTAARVIGVAAAATVIAGFGIFQTLGFIRGSASSLQTGITATMNDVLPWIRASTDTSAVIAGEDEALIWLYTGRRAVPSYLWRVNGRSAESFGPDTLRAYFQRSGATHLVLTGRESDAAPTIDALLAQQPGYLQMIRVWPGPMYAFRVNR